MKNETETTSQWTILRQIFENENGTFDWDDMRVAIVGLVYLKILKLDPHYFDNEEE